MANVCNVISAIRKCREGTGRLLYGHPIYNMTGPRSTAIRLEAAALDVQMRANMQNLLLVRATEGKTVMLITHSVEEAIYLASRIVAVTAIVALRSHIRALAMSEYR